MWPGAEAKADAWRAGIILDYHLGKQLPEIMLQHLKPLPHHVGPATKRSNRHTFAIGRFRIFGISLPARSADALSATLYGHFT